MHIGLDFDNTIACYDQSFIQVATKRNLLPLDWVGGKRALRDLLRAKGEAGELEWQFLQGQVYGELMPTARLKPGVGWFLLFCKARQVPVSIVSHKTEYSPKDPSRVPLRPAALSWMSSKRLFSSSGYGLSEDAVYFESTRHSKVARIASLGCTHFVDDLPEVFHQENFPDGVEKMLYDPEGGGQLLAEAVPVFDNWSSIGEALFGTESIAELQVIVRGLMPKEDVEKCFPISPGGNSTVFKVCSSRGSVSVLKRYPEEKNIRRDRLKTEVAACRVLDNLGIGQVTQVIHEDLENQIAVFRWIDGVTISHPKSRHIESLLEFVRELSDIKRTNEVSLLPGATEACLSGQEICEQIQGRRDRLGLIEIKFRELNIFLEQVFDPLLAQTVRWAQERWPQSCSFSESLSKRYQVLSPSDFGFHNALWEKSGTLRVIDLEYFGWDDPVKLASDFWWHPAMKLEQPLRQQWISGMHDLFSQDQDFANRLKVAHPLYGLRWAMIVLKPFLSQERVSIDREQILQNQLRKSMMFCDYVNDWVECGNQQF